MASLKSWYPVDETYWVFKLLKNAPSGCYPYSCLYDSYFASFGTAISTGEISYWYNGNQVRVKHDMFSLFSWLICPSMTCPNVSQINTPDLVRFSYSKLTIQVIRYFNMLAGHFLITMPRKLTVGQVKLRQYALSEVTTQWCTSCGCLLYRCWHLPLHQ